MSLTDSPRKRAVFFGDLAELTGAGISVAHTATLLSEDWREPAVRRAMGEMKRGLAEGGTIADSLRPNLSPMEHRVIAAAEKGGRLADGFRHLEHYYQVLGGTLSRLRAALLYPVFILHAAVLLPAVVAAVISGKSILGALLQGLALVWGGIGLCWFGWRALSKAAETSPAADRLLGMLPWAGAARRALAMARWHAVFHYCLTSGQRVSEGLRHAGDAARSVRLNEASRRAADAVEAGSELGAALRLQPDFPPRTAAAIVTAEAAGTLDTATERWTRESMDEAAGRMETAGKRVYAVVYGLVILLITWQILRTGMQYVGRYQDFSRELGL